MTVHIDYFQRCQDEGVTALEQPHAGVQYEPSRARSGVPTWGTHVGD